MNDDEWGCLPGSWNVFENSHGWRVTLDTSRLPGRMSNTQKHTYAAAILWALNHGEPNEGDKLNVLTNHTALAIEPLPAEEGEK